MGVFYVSVNYAKYIFISKMKKIEIVIYVHENMMWTSFQMYYHDLLQNKVTRFNSMTSVMEFIHYNSVIIGESTGVRQTCETITLKTFNIWITNTKKLNTKVK